MEQMPRRGARLVVDVREHGTVVGTDDPVNLEFEDCINAITGLTDWLARALAEVNEDGVDAIGSAMLIEALHQWTFNEPIGDEADDIEDEDEDEDEDEPDGGFDAK